MKLFLDGPDNWICLAKQIHRGDHNRQTAYDKFASLKANDGIRGVGPAYFTKLIFFLMKQSETNPRGYIMDQWVGCSINLLFKDNIVEMNKSINLTKLKSGKINMNSNFVVSDHNGSKNYENYCHAIEIVSHKLEMQPERTELLLMSLGGKNKHPWRQFVVEARLSNLIEEINVDKSL